MEPNEYGGLIWKMFYSPNQDGTGFVEIGKVFDVSPDNSSDDVTRNYIDGSSLKIVTNFVPSINFTTTKSTADNLKVAVPGNVYNANESIEGVTGAKAGSGGAYQLGPNISTKETTVGILKIVPQNAAQKQTITLFGATISINDFTFDDNLVEVPMVATGEKVIIGDVTYTSTS